MVSVGRILSDKIVANVEGDLIIMNFTTCDYCEKHMELQKKLIEIENLRKSGIQDISARDASQNLRKKLMQQANV